MKKRNEIWKDIPTMEGYYQVSNLGRVRSLDRKVETIRGIWTYKGRLLPQRVGTTGYYIVSINLDKKVKTRKTHQLVAMAFLNHKPCGFKMVVDHINNDPLDNRVENLQITTQRYNTSKDKNNKTSKYTGVSWHKVNKKWEVRIRINGIKLYLGQFKDEYQAHLIYEAKKKETL